MHIIAALYIYAQRSRQLVYNDDVVELILY